MPLATGHLGNRTVLWDWERIVLPQGKIVLLDVETLNSNRKMCTAESVFQLVYEGPHEEAKETRILIPDISKVQHG